MLLNGFSRIWDTSDCDRERKRWETERGIDINYIYREMIDVYRDIESEIDICREREKERETEREREREREREGEREWERESERKTQRESIEKDNSMVTIDRILIVVL